MEWGEVSKAGFSFNQSGIICFCPAFFKEERLSEFT
jgi:hypothetical protein